MIKYQVTYRLFTKQWATSDTLAAAGNYDVKGEILGNIGFKIIGLGAEGTQHSIGSSSFINTALQTLSPAVGLIQGITNHFMSTVGKAMGN